MLRRMTSVALVLLAGTAACSDDRVVDEPAFTAAITGAVTRPVAGTASFDVLSYSGAGRFTVAMEQGTAVGIVLQTRNGDEPATGSYPIVPNDDVAPPGEFRVVVHYQYGEAQEFTATSGTVTITGSSPELLKGTMQFRAVRTIPCCDPAPVTIDVTGAFVAAPEVPTSLR